MAFLGGLDLCLGRWDTIDHLIVDEETPYMHPGADYHNSFLGSYQYDFKMSDVGNVDRSYQPRMPFHDVSVRLEGSVAWDLYLHFANTW